MEMKNECEASIVQKEKERKEREKETKFSVKIKTEYRNEEILIRLLKKENRRTIEL